jgi:hypothetical protein
VVSTNGLNIPCPTSDLNPARLSAGSQPVSRSYENWACAFNRVSLKVEQYLWCNTLTYINCIYIYIYIWCVCVYIYNYIISSRWYDISYIILLISMKSYGARPAAWDHHGHVHWASLWARSRPHVTGLC